MSWGNKLLITFILFGSGMSYMVYRSMHTEFELVEKDYYKTELGYQDVIDATRHSQSLSSPVQWRETSQGLEMQLPGEMKNKLLSGTIWFYCAYNAAQDRKIEVQVDQDAVQSIPDTLLLPGTYTAKISWTDNDKQFYTESLLQVK